MSERELVEKLDELFSQLIPKSVIKKAIKLVKEAKK